MLSHAKEQRLLQAEIVKSSEPLLEIRDLLFEAKNAEGEKKEELVAQAQTKLRAFGKSLSAQPAGLARCVIQTKYVLSLHLAGMNQEASAALKEGIQNIESIKDPELETALYINMGECSLECGDSASFDFCFQKATEKMNASSNSKWKSEIAKTLENLQILASEKMHQ